MEEGRSGFAPVAWVRLGTDHPTKETSLNGLPGGEGGLFSPPSPPALFKRILGRESGFTGRSGIFHLPCPAGYW